MKIALFGEGGSGKDYIANILIRQYKFSRYAFSDGIRKLAEEYFPERYNLSEKDRKLLQDIGEKLREIDELIWVKYLFKEINQTTKERDLTSMSPEKIVITDLRQPHEYEYLKNEGYLFIRIQADENIRLKRMKARGDRFNKEDMSHKTESYYNTFEYDFVIENNGNNDSKLRSDIKLLLNYISSVK